MKNKITILAVMVGLLALVSGCALYKSESQYDQGEWKGWAGSGEVARIKSDKLAFAKLQAAPVQILVTNGVPQGLRGCVYNRSFYRDANVIIDGSEKRGIYITRGDKRYYWLVPGTYTATIYDENGNRRGQPRVFHVNAQTHDLLGEEVHWYIIAPP